MRIFVFLFFLFFSGWISAQTATIYGRCVSKNGKNLEGVHILVQGEDEHSFVTPNNGKFKIDVKSETPVQLIFSYGAEQFTRSYTLKDGEKLKIPDIQFDVVITTDILIRSKEDDRNSLPHLKPGSLATSDIGKTLALTTVATSNNELTSNYSVRGGNYDENLVYVNGFIVNRPFLTRSGQEEGLNFIYSSLVDNIKFSGGGFEANYGDKLSSVLDITYITPKKIEGSVMGSLLGTEAYIGQRVNSKFNYLVGARYRNNGYMLKALPTKGGYNPVYWDIQSLFNVNIRPNIVWSTLVHYSSNDYKFAPQSSATDFGTVNESYRLNIYFEGQQNSSFKTMTAATALKFKISDQLQLDIYGSVFHTNEREYFDVLGQYFINQLEKDPAKSNFGDSVGTIGIGSYLDHARNALVATVYNVYHNGKFQFSDRETDYNTYWKRNRSTLTWGVNYQINDFHDQLSEWHLIDSAGFSLPQDPNEIKMQEVIKGKLKLYDQQITGYVQYNFQHSNYIRNYPVALKIHVKDSTGKKHKKLFLETLNTSLKKWEFNIGTRVGYTDVNHELYVTPRAGVYFYPRSFMYKQGQAYRRNLLFRLTTGLYYQPPFYREFRKFDGTLNLDVKAQKSFHVVLGSEFNFNMWDRKQPFKFTAEAYYKYLWDVNPYEVDNVRIRYLAENNARAYAYGVDFNINGEFLEGLHSFFKLGLMSTKQDVLNDYYKIYYNAEGEKIIPGYTFDAVATDSVTVHPGYLPRPTDQWLNMAILFQDNMPKMEALSGTLALIFNTALPYGPPDHTLYADTLRSKAYFRVDFGISYDFLYNQRKRHQLKVKWLKEAVLSFEVYNLLGINNVLSYQWVRSVDERIFAVPNYLTQRRFNLKLYLKF